MVHSELNLERVFPERYSPPDIILDIPRIFSSVKISKKEGTVENVVILCNCTMS